MLKTFIKPEIEIAPPELFFPGLTVNSPEAKDISIRNISDKDIKILSVDYEGGFISLSYPERGEVQFPVKLGTGEILKTRVSVKPANSDVNQNYVHGTVTLHIDNEHVPTVPIPVNGQIAARAGENKTPWVADKTGKVRTRQIIIFPDSEKK